MQTQWIWAGMGERVGLNYAMIETTAAQIGLAMAPRVFLDLQIMEDEALTVMARQRVSRSRA